MNHIDDTPNDTRAALIEAATRLFAEQGFDGASLRAITEQAGANLASVNYHFGSKDGLIAAVLHAMVQPVNQLRLERLAELEAGAGPTVAELCAAFVDPMFELLGRRDRSGICLGLFGRLHLEPERFADLMRDEFQPVIERYLQAFQRCLPTLAKETLFCRLHLLIGGAIHLINIRRLDQRSPEHGGPDLDGGRDELITFATAGFTAGLEEG